MNKIIELEKKDFFDLDLDSPLRKVSLPVESFDMKLLQTIENLKKAFYSLRISVGLSAPQIGINKRLFILNINKKENKDLIVINPIIISNTGRKKSSYESCLSLPKIQGKVTRRDKLKLEYQDPEGKKQELNATGFLSRVILHEIDHLDGILFVDRLDQPKKIEPVNFQWD